MFIDQIAFVSLLYVLSCLNFFFFFYLWVRNPERLNQVCSKHRPRKSTQQTLTIESHLFSIRTPFLRQQRYCRHTLFTADVIYPKQKQNVLKKSDLRHVGVMMIHFDDARL